MDDLVERLRLGPKLSLSSGGFDHAEFLKCAKEAADRIEALEAALDAQEVEARYSDTGGLWRFWADKARKYVTENARLRKAMQFSEDERDEIIQAGWERHHKHMRSGGARGQTITKWDSPEAHVLEEAIERLRKAIGSE